MARLLAEELLLLCWNDQKGAVDRRCSSTLTPGIGGALVIDALLAGALAVDNKRVRGTGTHVDEPLLAEVVAEADRRRRTPTVKKLVGRVGTPARTKRVRDRLVTSGVLRAERRRVLGLFPVTRFPAADPSTVAAVRTPVRFLLTGQRDPGDAETREVVLAGLTKPTNAVDLLVERSQRKHARQRAESFGEGYGVPDAVGQAIKDAQAAAMAAVTAAVSASSAASSSSS